MSFGFASRLAIAVLFSVLTIVHWHKAHPNEAIAAGSFSSPTHLGDWNCLTTQSTSGSLAAYDLVWNGKCSHSLLKRADIEVIQLAKQTKSRRLPSPALNFSGNRLRSEGVYLDV